jgi:hypothetical protein
METHPESGQSPSLPVRLSLTGHKTESVYPRYAIVAEADLAEGSASWLT